MIKKDSAMYSLSMARYEFAVQYCEGKTVLDAGCSGGYGSHFLSKYAASVTGVDIGAETIAEAKQAFVSPSLEFKCADIAAIDCPNDHFDVICMFEVLEHLEECGGALAELKRVLKKGGHLLLSTPNGSFSEELISDEHVREYERSELTGLLGMYFTVVDVFGQYSSVKEREVFEGSKWKRFLKRLDLLGVWNLLPSAVRMLANKAFGFKTELDLDTGDYPISGERDDTARFFFVVCENNKDAKESS